MWAMTCMYVYSLVLFLVAYVWNSYICQYRKNTWSENKAPTSTVKKEILRKCRNTHFCFVCILYRGKKKDNTTKISTTAVIQRGKHIAYAHKCLWGFLLWPYCVCGNSAVGFSFQFYPHHFTCFAEQKAYICRAEALSCLNVYYKTRCLSGHINLHLVGSLTTENNYRRVEYFMNNAHGQSPKPPIDVYKSL